MNERAYTAFPTDTVYEILIKRRLEHLASLQIDLSAKHVIEIGDGRGDHATYFTNRGAQVTTILPDQTSFDIFSSILPQLNLRLTTSDAPIPDDLAPAEIVYMYDRLHDLRDPEAALSRCASLAENVFILDAHVAANDQAAETPPNPPAKASASAFIPGRPWLFERLSDLFPHCYSLQTQPIHYEYPKLWDGSSQSEKTRCIFIASRSEIENDLLSEFLVSKQYRHI